VQPAEYQALHQRLKALPEPRNPLRLAKEDWLGALGVFLVVFLSTFPVVIPFTFMTDITLALRISNATAIVMLFGAGYVYGRTTGRDPARVGVTMVVLGGVMVGITLALGG
jgi:VIT1/CCC1 family predicted Fe2+/Mn2+ transporter